MIVYAVYYGAHSLDLTTPEIVKVIWEGRGKAVVIHHAETDSSDRVRLVSLDDLYYKGHPFEDILKGWIPPAAAIARYEKARQSATDAKDALASEVRRLLEPGRQK